MTRSRDATLVIETASGRVRGFVDRGVPNWRGIPYGRVTQRFRPAHERHSVDLVDARAWGAVSWQVQMGASPERWTPLYPDAVKSEQCLNLNVWTRQPDRADPQPVLVWLHPGRHMVGGNMPTVDPWVFAAHHDVVIVSANYRLGPWGWLYLGALDPDFADGSNLAVRDQLLLLRWVRDNIARFGGDPGNVTLFGLSTGASDVATLLGVPAARGLFHQAAIYSGSADQVGELSEAARFAERFIAAAESLAQTPSELVNLSNTALRYIHRRTIQGGPARYDPVVDGDVLHQPPLRSIADGSVSEVPLLVSVTSDEARILDLVRGNAVDERYARLVEDDGHSGGSRHGVGHDDKISLLSRKLYVEPAERLLAAATGAGGHCWAQVFDYHPTTSHLAGNPLVSGKPVHGADTSALFCDVHGCAGTDEDRAVGAEEQRALIDLARNGRPDWQRYTVDRPVAKWLNPDSTDTQTLGALPGEP